MDQSLLSAGVRDGSEPGRPDRVEVLTRNPLRRYFISLALVATVLIGCAWVWAIKGRMWFLDPEYPMWSAKVNLAQQCAHGDTVILGASRAMAGLIPNELGPDVTNLALGGGSAIENYYMMDRVLRCSQPPKQVVIAFLPIDLTRDQAYWDRSALFGFLDFETMEVVRRESIELGDPLLYSTNRIATALDVVRNLSYRLSLPSYYFAAMMKAGFVGRKERNDREFALTLQSRGHHFFGRAARADGISEDGLVLESSNRPLLTDYMDRLIRRLSDANVKVYATSPPLNPQTFQSMSPNVVAGFNRYLDELRSKYPKLTFIGPPLHEMPADHFGDLEHLNAKGAAAWSGYVRGQVPELSK